MVVIAFVVFAAEPPPLFKRMSHHVAAVNALAAERGTTVSGRLRTFR